MVGQKKKAAGSKQAPERVRHSATTAEMPVPATSGVPAQGGMAATAVEAKRRVETHEQKMEELMKEMKELKKEKEELMKGFMQHLQVASGQVVFELLKPEHTELKKLLDSVNKQLDFVNTRFKTTLSIYADLVAIQKATQKRSLGSLGLTKEQVRKSAKKDFAKCIFEFQCDDWDDAPAFKDCLEACIIGKTDKQRRSVLVVASGMGDGKTRLLQELVGLAKKVPDLSKFNTVELRVNFENETGLRKDELTGDVDVNKILLDRLLFCMLAPEGQTFDVFRSEGHRWGFTCETLVAHIQEMFKEKEKDAMVFFLVDGIHDLDRDRPDSDSANWYQNSILRRMLDVVSLIIMSAAYRFVACSSTVSLPVQRAMANSRSVLKAMVSPPVLTRLPTEVTNKVVLEHKEQFLEMFGAHPRSMEVLVSNGGGTPAEVFEAAVDKLRAHYKIVGGYLSAGQLRTVLKYSLRPLVVADSSVGDANLETFLQNGLLRIRKGRLTVSPLYLMMELKHAITKGDGSVTEHPLYGWQPFGHGHEVDFEKYVAWVRCLRSRVFEGEVTIEKLHHGVRWVSRQPNISILSKPLELCAAAHQVHTASKGKAHAISDKKRMKKKRIKDWKVATSDAKCVDPLQACIVNAKGAAAGDVFSSVKTSAGVRLNEVIQAKAWLGGKEELPTDEVLKNANASASRGDLYLLVTRNTVTDAALAELKAAVRKGVHIGVVCNENFNEYYGPFAGTFLHETKRKAPPASNVLRSWTPRWDTTRALPAVHQAWLSPQLPLAAPRNAVNLLLLRRAAKVFS